ncbi:MAG: hypothetical protein QNJ13_05580 [Paracoccaceae bacterium]|nr:hypothetical protein [Paracoccaceae bacterium]
MKQASLLFAFIAAALVALDTVFGFATAYAIGYGAIALMALAISLTFLWLWWKRTTPLALGMSFSWAGAASVIGWWWFYSILDRPRGMEESEVLLVFVALYFVGATLHFAVIQRSLNLPRTAYLVPVLGSVVVSALVHLW